MAKFFSMLPVTSTSDDSYETFDKTIRDPTMNLECPGYRSDATTISYHGHNGIPTLVSDNDIRSTNYDSDSTTSIDAL